MHSVKERLDPTVRHAKDQKLKYEVSARRIGFALNTAIGLQVLLGALTTAVSAATATGTGHQVRCSLMPLMVSRLFCLGARRQLYPPPFSVRPLPLAL